MVETLQAEQIREHGGRAGLRDEGLLESALARPQNVFSHDTEADLAALAAEYGFGLARNHAFIDGNKRIVFVAVNVFLIVNGYEIEAPEPEVVEIMLQLADGRLTRGKFAERLRRVMVPVLEEG